MGDSIKIVFTPLHGAGNLLVRRILKETGCHNVFVVAEQELPDPDFPTVEYPNPEEKQAFTLAISLAEKVGADLILATDPDGDRVGVAVLAEAGGYVNLTGNQTGSILMEYLLSRKKAGGVLPPNAFTVKTIVTSELARTISVSYGVEMVEVLTGFKFIGEKIKELDEFGDKKYIFGFEESYGYLAGTFSRDKDGVSTCMLLAEVAAFCKSTGITMLNYLNQIYAKYGYFVEGINSFTLEGKAGLEKIDSTMSALRKEDVSVFKNQNIKAKRDYLTGYRECKEDGQSTKLGLPESNVLYYEIADGGWFAVRPSGTEPKIKIYYGVSDKSCELAETKLSHLKRDVIEVITKYLQ